MKTLDQLDPGTGGIVEAIAGPMALQQRLMEFGVLEGETISVLAKAPLGDPIEIQIGGTRLSLRKTEAAAIRLAESS
ncbi:FeoA family protein [Zavarzinella formosa]|uniref:FeoA family protein n=1 Tax=Zavarzinella formosa TaxID=360055 RepID=UPI0002F87625|nr:ferrous iron transport protein A [Zavarzinella formosa]